MNQEQREAIKQTIESIGNKISITRAEKTELEIRINELTKLIVRSEEIIKKLKQGFD